MEKVAYGGWPNCIRLSNDTIEVIATTDVGPRIMRAGFIGGPNLMKEFEDQLGQTGGDEWVPYGGHRLWHAPEVSPRTYAPDNEPIEHEWDGTTLTLTQPTEELTRLQKVMEITLDPEQPYVHINHRIINHNLWAVTFAPWALTMMAQGGRVIFPQEPFRPHPEYFLPARPFVIWHYTDLSDPRWTITAKYIQLRQDPGADNKEKAGMLNKQGWGAYELEGNVLIKQFEYVEEAEYTDYGCNAETYTDADIIELETLGPLVELEPGEEVDHVEHWTLFQADIGMTDAELDANLLPLVEQSVDMAE